MAEMTTASTFATASPRVRRRALLIAAAVAPGLVIVLVDLARRGAQLAAYPPSVVETYAATALLSVVFWGALALAGAARAGWERWLARALALVAAGFAVGAQSYFFHRYHAYLNHRAVLVGTSMMASVGQQLWSDLRAFVFALAPPLFVAIALPMGLARVAPPSPARARAALDGALLLLAATLFVVAPTRGGEQGATPDVLYLSAMGSLAEARWTHAPEVERLHPGPRAPLPVPAIGHRRDRDVLLILDESLRADDVCIGFDPACKTTPFTNEAAPRRIPLRQMRALDSTTAVSLAVLWSGLPATATREEFHTLPLLWEYAHAAGFDTAYWTSQNPFFANAGLWLSGVPLAHAVTATELDPEPTYELGADDGKLVDAVVRDLQALKEPFVGVVHLSNTHFPYKIDPADAPFQPESEAVGAGDAEAVHNRYRDAVYLQDRHVARLLRELRARPIGARTVVVFVSDHGEQIRERGAIGHTDNVQEEEIRVPMWIDGPLDDAEAAELRALEDAPLTMLDVMPTLLDLMGVLDAPEIGQLRARMPGESLLRGGSPRDRPALLTNCTTIFTCAFPNWGAIRGTKKILATQNDVAWRCYDVADDPGEENDLGAAACGDLRAFAEADGRGTPF